MRTAAAIWRFWTRAELTVWLLLALVADLYAGFFIFRAAPQLFGPLNRLKLWEWFQTYGLYHLGQTWWFWAFLLLMALLVLNTLACTLQRLITLARQGPRGKGRLAYALRYSPHVMHLAFVLILVSHLITFTVGVNDQNNILVKGREIPLPGSEYRIRLLGVENHFYQGDRLEFYQGRPLSQEIRLGIRGPKGEETVKTLGILAPAWFRGYSLHLKKYRPNRRDAGERPPFVNLIIRKDPGILLFTAGSLLFVLGLLAYFLQALGQGLGVNHQAKDL